MLGWAVKEAVLKPPLVKGMIPGNVLCVEILHFWMDVT
jgi:hypothetical protein